jgi:hypothetical protein
LQDPVKVRLERDAKSASDNNRRADDKYAQDGPEAGKKMQMDLVRLVPESAEREPNRSRIMRTLEVKRKRSPMLPEHCRDASESEYGMRKDGFVEGGVEQEVAFKEGRLRVEPGSLDNMDTKSAT